MKGSFLNQNTRNSNFFLVSSEKKSHFSGCVIARTVQLNCPTKAEIRAVDSQSDLGIFGYRNRYNVTIFKAKDC